MTKLQVERTDIHKILWSFYASGVKCVCVFLSSNSMILPYTIVHAKQTTAKVYPQEELLTIKSRGETK